MMKKTNLILLLTLIVLVSSFFVLRHKKIIGSDGAQKSLVWNPSSLSKLGLHYKSTTATLSKEGSRWAVTEWNDKRVLDTRSQNDFVQHILDLMGTLKDLSSQPHAAEASAQYGMEKPELILSYEWIEPETFTHRSGVIFFGNRDLSQKKIFAFLPKSSENSGNKLVEVSSQLVDLIIQSPPEKLRDQRLVSFDTDDVIEFRSTGKCPQITFFRDGDHWNVEKKSLPAQKTKPIHLALKKLLETPYEKVLEDKPAPSINFENIQANAFAKTLSCVVKLNGLRNRNEFLFLYEEGKNMMAVNTALRATYLAPRDYFKRLGELSKALH